MTREELTEWAKRHGFTEDRFGHMQKTTGKGEYRLKLQATSFRYEKRLRFPAGEYIHTRSEWMRLGGGYYSNTELTSEDKLSSRKAKRPRSGRRDCPARLGDFRGRRTRNGACKAHRP